MSRFPMPIDKESSEALLSKFMENAMNSKLKDHFRRAAEILYGKSFDVRLDLSLRMYFFCRVCTKDMNSVKSLIDHVASGTHIKNEDTKKQEMMSFVKKEQKVLGDYKPGTLHYKLQNAKIDIIGLQHIEGYSSGKSMYFKCNLCGAHGKADAIYNHVIGNSHTDKYIKTRIARVPVMDAEVRQRLRKIISERESKSYSVDDVKIIKGSEYYPFLWEQEAGRARNRASNRKGSIEAPMEALAIKPVEPKDKEKDKENRIMSYNKFNQLLLKFNVIVHAHFNDRTDIYETEDLKMALHIISYVLHLLFYYNRKLLKSTNNEQEAKDEQRIKNLEEQKLVISTCLGYVHKRLICEFERLNQCSVSYK